MSAAAQPRSAMSAVNRATFQQIFGRGGLSIIGKEWTRLPGIVKWFFARIGQKSLSRRYHDSYRGSTHRHRASVWRLVEGLTGRPFTRADRAAAAPVRQRGGAKTRSITVVED